MIEEENCFYLVMIALDLRHWQLWGQILPLHWLYSWGEWRLTRLL